MLMMLAWFRNWPEAIAADAHDAGLVPELGQRPLQLMLMMLAGFGQKAVQLVLMMLAQFRNLGKGHCSC